MAQSLDKYSQMVSLLHQKTLAGEIEWSSTSIDDVFATTLGLYTIRISVEERTRTTDVVVSLYNDEGDLVDSFSDVTLKDDVPFEFASYFEMMKDLHILARRSATGADKVIDDILGLLNRKVSK